MVCLGRVPEGMKVESVSVQNVAGACHAVRHLISQGRQTSAMPVKIRLATNLLIRESSTGFRFSY
jgi:DNA-binding LacI/PurR family transcriptional regulator